MGDTNDLTKGQKPQTGDFGERPQQVVTIIHEGAKPQTTPAAQTGSGKPPASK